MIFSCSWSGCPSQGRCNPAPTPNGSCTTRVQPEPQPRMKEGLTVRTLLGALLTKDCRFFADRMSPHP